MFTLLATSLITLAPVTLDGSVILTKILVVSGDAGTSSTGGDSGGTSLSSSSSSSSSSFPSSFSSSSTGDEVYAAQWKKLLGQDEDKQLAQLKSGLHISLSPGGLGALDPNFRSMILGQSVYTLDQLRLFIRAVLEEYPEMRSVEVRSDSLLVTYRMKAWFFGVIPTQYLLRVTATDDGTVTVKGPWWLSLSRDGVSAVRSSLTESLKDLLSAEDSEPIEALLKRRQNVLLAIVAILAH